MSVSGLEGSKFWVRNHFDTAKQGLMDKLAEDAKSINLVELRDKERQRWIEFGGKPSGNSGSKTWKAKALPMRGNPRYDNPPQPGIG